MSKQRVLLGVGADPEVFVIYKPGNFIVPVVGLIGGSKDSPLDLGDGVFVQEDNVAAEFNISPAKNASEFSFNISNALLKLQGKLGEDFTFDIRASHVFEPEMLQHPACMVFGCDPDFNAYTLKQNISPEASTVGGLRACAGHLHIGYDKPDKEFDFKLVKHLDMYLGIPSLIYDTDTNRRKLYGKAGALRHKPYGVEYRSLSNFWLKSKELMEWVYNQVDIAFNEALNPEIDDVMSKEIESIINTHDIPKAERFVEEYKIQMI